jgi:hypothetical protein
MADRTTSGLRTIPAQCLPILNVPIRPISEPHVDSAPVEVKYPALTIIEVLGLQEDLPKVDPRSKGAERTDQILERREFIVRFCRQLLSQRIRNIPPDNYEGYLEKLYLDISNLITSTDITGEELSPLGIGIRLDTNNPSHIILSISINEGRRKFERSIVKPDRWATNNWYRRPNPREL